MSSPTRTLLTAAALLSLTTFATGCPKKGAAAGGDAGADGGGKKVGLDAAGNDPAFVTATKSTMEACAAKWEPKKGFDDCNDPMRTYRENKFTGIDTTLLNTLEDEDPKVRWFGAYALSAWGSSYRSDKALCSRLFAVLENEKAGSIIDGQLAYAATNTFEAGGLADRLKAHGLKATTPLDVKEVLAVWWSNDAGYDITKTLLASPDKKSVKAASQGYATHFSKHEDEACKFWAAHLEDDDKDVRASAVGHLTGGWSGNTTHDADGIWYVSGGGGGPASFGDAWCTPAEVDDALAKIAKRAAANTVDESNYIYGLTNIVHHKKPTDAQKKLAIATFKKIIETKGATQRTFALRKLIEAKPDEKAYAAKFLKDDELKSTAADLTKPTPPK